MNYFLYKVFKFVNKHKNKKKEVLTQGHLILLHLTCIERGNFVLEFIDYY